MQKGPIMRTKAEKIFIKIILVAFMMVMSIPTVASDKITAKIPVTCNAVQISDQFNYTITPLENAPVPEKTSLTLKDGETGNFEISYTDPNTWHYEIKQEKGTSDIQYDTTIYKAIVMIGVREDGTLYSEVSISKEGSSSKSDSCEFDNISGSLTESTTESTTESKTESTAESTDTKKKKEKKNTENTQTNKTRNTTSTSSDVIQVYPQEKANTPNVQTGDENRPLFYLFVMMSALLIGGSCILIYKRGRKNA